METLKKSTDLLNKIQDTTNLLQYAERIELKRQRAGHYRLYVACMANTPIGASDGTDEAAEASGFTANPYRKGGFLTSVSFADNDEPQGRK